MSKPVINQADYELAGYREWHQNHFPHEDGLSDPQLIPIVHAAKTNQNESINQENTVTA